MIIAFTPVAWEDYRFWQENDEKIVDKINILMKEITRDPFIGLGKPEALKGNLKSYWSRRITGEHRLVYRVDGNKPNQTLIVIKLRFHY